MTDNQSSQPHELVEFLRAATDRVARDYELIQRRATDDPGTAGDQGEENWATLLRNWLPPMYPIVTKGRILARDGWASPQVDVLVLHPSYPVHLRDQKLYLAGGVVAAFECKITLRTEHIRRAVSTAAFIRRHLRPRRGTPYKELNSPLIYGLLAHSHSWKEEKSTPVKNIDDQLYQADLNTTQHPREMLDLLCVADLAIWFNLKNPWLGPALVPGWSDETSALYGPNGAALTSFEHFPFVPEQLERLFPPVGVLISLLLSRLAWEDPGMRNFAEYFNEVGHPHGFVTRRPKCWPAEIYSEPVRNVVTRYQSHSIWDEWSLFF